MSDRTDRLTRALTLPASASHGSGVERWVAITVVGVGTGVLAAMAMYPFRFQDLTHPWASEALLAGIAFVAGVLVKFLVEEMRASVTAFLLSWFVGSVALVAFQVAPFYLTGGSSLGLRVYLPLRDIVTFLFMIQFPLQLSGYLSMVVYDGYHS